MTLKHTSFIVTGAILIVAVVAVAPYANVGNTQGANMMKNTSRTIKMIAPGGNTSNTINMSAREGNLGKTINTSNTINMTAREWNLGKTIKIIH
jgi:hypothetical protein